MSEIRREGEAMTGECDEIKELGASTKTVDRLLVELTAAIYLQRMAYADVLTMLEKKMEAADK